MADKDIKIRAMLDMQQFDQQMQQMQTRLNTMQQSQRQMGQVSANLSNSDPMLAGLARNAGGGGYGYRERCNHYCSGSSNINGCSYFTIE